MTGSAYQAQLVQQLRAAEDELAALRPIRRQLADAQAGTAEREALLTEARDLLEPWGGHGDGWPSIVPAIGTLIEKLNDALARAATAEAVRDQFAVGLPLVCSDARHEAKIRGLEQLLTAGQKTVEHWEGAYTREVAAHGKTEGAVSRVRAECERIVAEVYGQHDEDDNGMREAVRRITAAIDGEVCHCSLLNGCDCGMPAATEVVRGGRRLRHSAATRNVIKASDHDGGTDNVIKERSCPPDCTTAHTYEAPCTVDPLAVPNGSIPYLGSGRGMWAWTCGGADWCDGMSRTDYSSAADARRAYDRHVRHAHAESLPATHESRVWEDDGEWHASCPVCPAYVDNIGGEDDAEQWAAEHKAQP
jgi:hypothetical protein